MKEDKSDEWIASSLKKHLEEGQLPYEIGAWEEFQKVRNSRKRRAAYYWMGAVAASLLLLVGISQVFLDSDFIPNQELDTSEMLSEQTLEQEENPILDNALDTGLRGEVDESVEPELLAKSIEKVQSEAVNRNGLEEKSSVEEPGQGIEADPFVSNAGKKENLVALEEVKELEEKEIENSLKLKEEVKKNAELPSSSSGLIAALEKQPEAKSVRETVVKINKAQENNLVAKVEEEDFPEIPKDHTTVSLGMGVSPGFGTLQQDDVNTTASSIGVGMLLDVDLPGKLTIGSGFGVNYMNQQNKSQMPVTIAGYRTSQVEKQNIQQVQLELPVYFKYPITRNNAVSIQAGFSNLYAINQSAEQMTTVNEQVAVNNLSDANSSAFALASKAVSQTEVLQTEDSKFYPFATLNFGLNIRLVETKNANYLVMPFYNHQLRSISGFGTNFGMFGASLKLNFGGSEK
ncbi:hypothetical protein JYB62_01260 [Algoriphagus lutimaris]|uniref:outer membrane beta-barrel protein n=1 Tax=Algoriphagus lutimaris TaxID=613197 RepID=UPI00196B44A1|nr:outer membrane beta-barrel protein [Algoriphagus lutimaris]MBN3518615.1 hypothetical protein [Algoriphagus lutimaris]